MSSTDRPDHDSKADKEWKLEIDKLKESSQNKKASSQRYSDDLAPTAMAKLIDHTLLKLDATPEQVDKLCDEARQWNFKTVCVRLNFVKQAAARLKDTEVGVTCVIGFHEGTHSTNDKVSEAKAALEAGATELDTVLNRTAFEAGSYSSIYGELKALRALNFPQEPSSSVDRKPVLKLILETSQLQSSEDIRAACYIAACAGCDFVKTSTGFCGRGASVEDVEIMKSMCDAAATMGTTERRMQVKASGGIRTYEDARKMVHAGAGRLGVSAGVEIVQGAQNAHKGFKAGQGDDGDGNVATRQDGY